MNIGRRSLRRPRQAGSQTVQARLCSATISRAVFFWRAHTTPSMCRHAQQKEYELVGGTRGGADGAGDSAVGGGDRSIRRCPSKFFVPGLDSTGAPAATVIQSP